jgi:hypothetical protein
MTAKIVLVIKDIDDSRVREFGKWFSCNTDAEVFLVFERGDWVLLDSHGADGEVIESQDRPKRADALLVHESNWDEFLPGVKKQLSEGISGRVFVFNSPGDPKCKEDAIRILRSTNPFTLPERDAQQLIKSATDPNAALPSCCTRSASTLRALDFLCQGFRATHNDSSLPGLDGLSSEQREAWMALGGKTEKMEWWLDGIQIESLIELDHRLKQEEVSDVDRENVRSKLKAVEETLNAIDGRETPQLNNISGKLQALESVRELNIVLKEILA